MDHDYAFEMAASNLRFGSGATSEVGMDLAETGDPPGARADRPEPGLV